MFTAYQVLALLIEFVVMLTAVWGIVVKSQIGLKRDLSDAQAVLKRDLTDTLRDVQVEHTKSYEESSRQFQRISENFNQIGLQLNTILQGDVRELQARVQKLESGQDEWTKTLRERTHDFAGELNRLVLKVDRLERPVPTRLVHDEEP